MFDSTLFSDFFDVQKAAEQEAQRWLKMLADLKDAPEFEFIRFSKRAREIGVQVKVLRRKHLLFLTKGVEGLRPELRELSARSMQTAYNRYEMLKPLRTDFEALGLIRPETIQQLRDQYGWSIRQAQRLVRRHQEGGLFGLAPESNPEKRQHPQKPPTAMGLLHEHEVEQAFAKLELLGDELATKENATRAEMQERADRVGVSERTLWSIRASYKSGGLAALARRERSDKGRLHNLSERIVSMVAALFLKNQTWPTQKILEEITSRAIQLGEIPPSEFQIRSIINGLSEPVKLVARHDWRQFASKCEVAGMMLFLGVWYQTDHTPLDLKVIDERPKRFRNPDGQVRPILSLTADSNSRLLLAWRVGYLDPDRHWVTAQIREAILSKLIRGYGGIPDGWLVDGAREFSATIVKVLSHELGIELRTRKAAKHGGIIEQMVDRVNHELCPRLPGYTGKDEKEMLPGVKAVLTLGQLQDEYLGPFIEKYNYSIHSTLGVSPIEFWQENCFAESISDPRLLDLLLLEPREAHVYKGHIRAFNRQYFHPDLGQVEGSVLIRSEPRELNPLTIEVFVGGQWFCTATSMGSKGTRNPNGAQVFAAKRAQRQYYKAEVETRVEVLKAADKKIAESTKDKPTQVVSHEQEAAELNEAPSEASAAQSGELQEGKSREHMLVEQVSQEQDLDEQNQEPTVEGTAQFGGMQEGEFPSPRTSHSADIERAPFDRSKLIISEDEGLDEW